MRTTGLHKIARVDLGSKHEQNKLMIMKSITKNNKESKFHKNSILEMNEQTLNRIHPALAAEIGLNPSILLLQLDFWCAISSETRCVRGGKRWTFQSHADMHEKLPFLSETTICRTIKKLKTLNLIQVDNFNKRKGDRTGWYRINEEGIRSLSSIRLKDEHLQVDSVQHEAAAVRNEPTEIQDEPTEIQGEPTLPENTSETTAENTSEITFRYTADCEQSDLDESFSCEVLPRNTGGIETSFPLDESFRAVAAFESVGVTRFDVTFRDDISGEAKVYVESVDLSNRKILARALELNEEEGWSFIARPRGSNLIQVDDVDVEGVKILIHQAFFVEETSEGSYQVWLALPHGTEEELKSIRSRLLRGLRGNGNGGSFGATRWVGSINQKPERKGFRVRLIEASDGWFTSAGELEDAGLLTEATADPNGGFNKGTYVNPSFDAKFPSYDECLRSKGDDRSKADASFLKLCKMRGVSREAAVSQLYDVSDRAIKSGTRYVERTAE
ncbi:MAG: hypothetical protein ABIP00_15410, partial [Pyrinomonadaceae bacterium]